MGSHEVRAEKRGFVPWKGTLVVQHGESNTLTVPAMVEVPPEKPVVVAPPPESGFPWDWTAIGTGGALVTTGVVLQLMAGSKRDEISDASGENGIIESMTEQEALDLQDSADSLATMGAVTIGVGAVALSAGVVMLLMDSDDDEQPQVGFMITSDEIVVGVGGRF